MSARETEGVVEENELGIKVFLGGSRESVQIFIVCLLYVLPLEIQLPGPPREFLGPRAKGNLTPPSPILQIMILKLSPPRCVISKESVPGVDPGFQVRGGGGALKKIAPSGGRREHFWGISCENSRFYAKKADYRISLLPLTSNSKNKTVVSKLHCMSNLQFKFHFNPVSGYLGVAGCRIILLPPPPGVQ